ncbi:hypothetical protein F511_44277 [Dorcoceras hygrometricum]|uniref:Uncharacterized protein n=1 Tax=Dorcoceras hygrometricum TaxID=472368 RepID=A0A2Z7AT56_9LAMI|nr:hypothetical protein F511_44277 [Dorcoceras hygrometricum]
MMTAIHFGLKVNWSKVLFNVLKDMVDKSQMKAKGFAAQIGVLMKGMPAIALGEGVPFPFAKILSMKTVNTYIATNTTIDAREEQGMVDSFEHDLQFALGPAIFPSVAQEERIYYVQSLESSPAISLPQESSSSSTDVSMHFNSEDISLNARTDTQPSAPVDFTVFTDALEDISLSMSQRIHESNCEILSKINFVEIGIREALLKQTDLIR